MILSRDNPTQSSIPPTLSPWRISTERYLEMAGEGVFEGDRVELINGMIIDMSPAGTKHAAVVNRISKLFTRMCGELEPWTQSTMVIAKGQVYEPDFALLKPRSASDPYTNRHPGPDDVALLIEVCGSSLAKDREVKLPVYAAAGIAEVWLVDIESDTVQVCREPKDQGYGSMQTVGAGQEFTAVCLPGQAVGVDALFA